MPDWKKTVVDGKLRISTWIRAHKTNLIEQGKTALILLLFLSACFLSAQSGVLGEDGISDLKLWAATLVNGSNSAPVSSSGRKYEVVARPQVMAVFPEAGTRYAAMYSSEVDSLYDRFSAYLGEALGTAGTPETVTRQAWEEALSGKGIFFDFIAPENLVCLAAWQGVSVPKSDLNHNARRLFLSVEETGIRLYYISEPDGMIYCCTTALDRSAVESRMAVYHSNDAWFAFEREETAALDPDVMILPGAKEVWALSVSSVNTATPPEMFLQYFGMNSITATSYLETSGMTVYLDGDSTLRVSGDGRISYEYEAEAGSSENVPYGVSALPDIVDSMYRIVVNLAAESMGDSEIRLTSAAYDARKDTYTVWFAYFIDGMQICYASGNAAEFTITGGTLTHAEIQLRQYQLTGETQIPLPFVQAAALAIAEGSTEPVRVYQDMGDFVTVSWRIR